ncbi:hypothetical protein [Cumulibacter manganitolerans]|uniref:hypothetical protein n=1 Tax=Cumulibacter manganitolerans TaxID=1884992 RepID=UPI0012972A80|nr:hypothetical protein [Cumulibacter manganitolerans]
MVLWICVGVLVLALGLVGVLVFDLRGRVARFEAAVTAAERQTAPALGVVRTLADVQVPSIRPAPVRRLSVGEEHTVRDRG